MNPSAIDHSKPGLLQLKPGKPPLYPLRQVAVKASAIMLHLSPFGAKLLVPGKRRINGSRVLISSYIDSYMGTPLILSACIKYRKRQQASPIEEIGCLFNPLSDAKKLQIMDIIRLQNTHNHGHYFHCEISEAPV